MSDAPIASVDVLNVHGLYADPTEPHARPGNHVRVTSHPLLGLPAAPLMYWRGMLDDKSMRRLRTDVTFRDLDGSTLTAPVEVRPDRPIEVHFGSAGGTCIFANLIVDTNQLDVEMYVPSALGPVHAGTRSDFPYSVSAHSIAHLVLRSRSGSHQVNEVRWAALNEFPDLGLDQWTISQLPHPGTIRYLQTDDWEAEVEGRIVLQAPQRRPLQEETGRPAPLAASVEGPAFELDRVMSLTDEVRVKDLPPLLTDLSQRQRDMFAEEDVVDQTGTALVTKDDVPEAVAQVNRLGRVLTATLDPGSASCLGFKAVDPWQDDPRIMVYWVEAIFEDFTVDIDLNPFNPVPLAGIEDELVFASTLDDADPERVSHTDAFDVVDRFVNGVGTISPLAPGQSLHPAKNYLRMAGWCVVDERAPLDPPPNPTVTGAEQVRWLPVPPPDAMREVRLDLAGVDIGGLLAVDRRAGAPGERINSKNDDGFHLPIVLGLDSDDPNRPADAAPGEGSVTDPAAPEASADYGIAQQDRFGRWSTWAQAVVAPAARPGPPSPVFQGYSIQADPNADPIGRGDIRIIAQIPPPASLAPASFPVRRLHVEATDLSATPPTTVTSTHVVANPTGVSAGDQLDVSFLAPELDRTEQRTVRLRTRWEDTSGTIGPDSTDQLLEVVDPRPPLPIDVPDTLEYTGRPDVTGLAWAEHTWQPGPGQETAMLYHADETRIRSMLERAGNQAFLDALDAAPDDPARATVYRTRGAELSEAYFERVQDAIVDNGDDTLTFRHAVSGSLRGFVLYRIGSESSVGAAAPVASLPTLVFSVPNSDPPMTPLIDVKQGDGANGSLTADVTVSWEPGPTPVAAVRLRRSRAVSENPLRMPVVTSRPITNDEADAASVELPDAGPVEISQSASLRPWTLYSWVAEVRGPDEPGSNPPIAGRWSRPSAPFGMLLTPPDPPAPITAATAAGVATTGGATEVEIKVDHPEHLDGGTVGPYRLVTIRTVPGRPAERLAEQELSGSGPHVVPGTRPADGPDLDVVTADTTYRLTLVDPLGRPSPTLMVDGVTIRP